MPPVRAAAVLMPTYQGIEFLDRVLTALSRQETSFPWSFHAVDSGSRDGTWELLHEWKDRLGVAVRLERIHQVEFDHGDTRNHLAAQSCLVEQGEPEPELFVFLTQDAIPAGSSWLETLAANFTDPAVAAATCRNVPRPDAHPLTKVFSVDDPGYATERREVRMPPAGEYASMSADERRALWNFNDVASAIRRSAWKRHPFPRTWFGEDVLMARALLEAGYTIVYDAEATVEHSHDYNADENYARGRIDGRFNAEWLDRVCVERPEHVDILTERVWEGDALRLREQELPGTSYEAVAREGRALRRALFAGLQVGGETLERREATQVLEDPALKILYVVHGFPPDTWAGTEIYTYNLALEMQRRGHEVTILARVPGDERELPELHVEESEFQGLRVLRLTHRLQHASLRESFHKPAAEAAFRTVLASERPDVVHFQHLIHTSIGLVQVARSAGLATVVHCHDYWALCARVQMIRPDGSICPSNMGSGCYLCVKEEGLTHVERAHKLDTVGGDLARTLARDLLSAEATTDKRARQANEYIDMMARHEEVAAAYAACDLRISPSRFLRDKLLESGAFDPHTFLYSDNGMRTDHVAVLENHPDPSGRVRFGFVGSLVWYKGGETMVRAMNRLAGERAVLNVYGTFDPENDQHHAELEALATAGNVSFKGRFDNARLSEVYAEIDVLVVPSVWYENSPITIHEAWLTETPILCSDIGGMKEFVVDADEDPEAAFGLHFRVGDDADLASKMRRILHEEGLLQRLSRSFPAAKTIREDAADMEFRYRGLVCRERSLQEGGVLLDWTAASARRDGECDEQGADLVLVRPGGALEWDLHAPLPGQYRLELGLYLLAAEPEVTHACDVLVDGVRVASVEPVLASAEDEARVVGVELELGEAARTLRLSAGTHHLRLSAARLLR